MKKPIKTKSEKIDEKCRIEAEVVKKLYDSFLYNGFTNEQAFDLIKHHIDNCFVEDLVSEYL